MKLETKIKSRDLFDKLEREYEQGSRKLKTKKSDVLTTLIKEFKKTKTYTMAHNHTDWDGGYFACLEKIKQIPYTAKDVEYFSAVLGEYQDCKDFEYRSSTFLCALIDYCKESDIVVFTKHLSTLPEEIGYKNNNKNITVKGNGDNIGELMEGGHIKVEGNVYRAGTDMKGGCIEIEGDVKGDVGRLMSAGLIEVKGRVEGWIADAMTGGIIKIYGGLRARHHIGQGMRCGEVYVYGKYLNMPKIARGEEFNGCEGKIYHNNKLIFDGEV